MGKKAYRNGWAQGGDQKKRRGYRGRPRCLNCNKLCPILSRAGFEEICGWKRREAPYRKGDAAYNVETYCPECFDQWGWCDDPRRSAKHVVR